MMRVPWPDHRRWSSGWQTAALGALTVIATHLLRAALPATAPRHIVVNSHAAWQNPTTPLYSALCCWALARALRRADLPVGRREPRGAAGRPTMPGGTGSV